LALLTENDVRASKENEARKEKKAINKPNAKSKENAATSKKSTGFVVFQDPEPATKAGKSKTAGLATDSVSAKTRNVGNKRTSETQTEGDNGHDYKKMYERVCAEAEQLETSEMEALMRAAELAASLRDAQEREKKLKEELEELQDNYKARGRALELLKEVAEETQEENERLKTENQAMKESMANELERELGLDD